MKRLIPIIALALLFFKGCYPEPQAAFTAEYDDNTAPAEVTFTNYSEYAEQFYWDFGDGETSTYTNPIHTYYYWGDMTVTLEATGRGGVGYAQTYLTIQQPTTYIVRNYSSYVLYDVMSYYWDSYDVYDLVSHGTLDSYEDSDEVLTSRTLIDVAFRFEPGGDLILVADSYSLSIHYRNYLLINDQTQVYVSAGGSDTDLTDFTLKKLKKSSPVSLREYMEGRGIN